METPIDRQYLLNELKNLPEGLLGEVSDYISKLKARRENRDRIDTTFASQNSLAKDWLKPEEDEAWQDL